MKVQKQVTVNDMLRDALLTKMPKQPKYTITLSYLGYEWFDSGWSEQGYWSIRPTGDKSFGICISKGNDGKLHLFRGPKFLRKVKRGEQIQSVLKLIDLENAVKACSKERFRPWELTVGVMLPNSPFVNCQTPVPFFRYFPRGSKLAQYYHLTSRFEENQRRFFSHKDIVKAKEIELSAEKKKLSDEKEKRDESFYALNDFLNSTIYKK